MLLENLKKLQLITDMNVFSVLGKVYKTFFHAFPNVSKILF